MNTDVVIVGAGPAGIFTALEMLKKGSRQKILIVEKGRAVEDRRCPKSKAGQCVSCKPYCHITTGFSGAGAFSDGKLSLSYEVGGDLPTLIGADRAQETIDYTDKIYLEFGADAHVEGLGNTEEVKAIRKRAIRAGLKLVDCPIRHLGTEKAQELYYAIEQHLLKNGVEILFVGAEGRMEMEKIPALGYRIVGLPIAGLQRRLDPKNLAVPFKAWRSIRRARRAIRDFGADAVAGFGGYASAPVLWAAQRMGVPTLIQEQNSYAGLTNKLLARGARRICVAYDGMERFFPADKIIKTGNPVRQSLIDNGMSKEDARTALGLDPDKKTIVLVGGSLGARTINESVMQHLDMVKSADDTQFLLQTGKYYNADITERLKGRKPANLTVTDFIADMGTAYAAADLVVSRAGASSISEFCLIGKPVVLVPSPNVAEDHQTKNAMALVDRQAAIYVKDADAAATLLETALATVADSARLDTLSANIRQLALPDSAERIAREVIRLAERK